MVVLVVAVVSVTIERIRSLDREGRGGLAFGWRAGGGGEVLVGVAAEIEVRLHLGKILSLQIYRGPCRLQHSRGLPHLELWVLQHCPR